MHQPAIILINGDGEVRGDYRPHRRGELAVVDQQSALAMLAFSEPAIAVMPMNCRN